jgi:uncharacterized protein (TIGR02145 family)
MICQKNKKWERHSKRFGKMSEMSEKCPVCKTECENGATVCSVCGFAYEPKIDMTWPIPEDAKNWIETVVKPYRMQWEAKQREAVLLAQLEESKKREADLLSQLEETKKQNISSEVLENTFTDPRDGKVYRTVKIGSQVWMAENLNYNAPGSVCYNNDPRNGEKYGRLYDWETAKKACPPGWHLPSDKEWNVLINFAGGSGVGGKHLKAKNDWNDYNGKSGNGTDIYGFAALPGGGGNRFYCVGGTGCWWSASKRNIEDYDPNATYAIKFANAHPNSFLGMNSSNDVGLIDCNMSRLLSVRCVQDVRESQKESHDKLEKLRKIEAELLGIPYP